VVRYYWLLLAAEEEVADREQDGKNVVCTA
jgi:hypothetical protein